MNIEATEHPYVDEFELGCDILDHNGPVLITARQRISILKSHGHTLHEYETDRSPMAGDPGDAIPYEHGTAKHLLAWLGY